MYIISLCETDLKWDVYIYIPRYIYARPYMYTTLITVAAGFDTVYTETYMCIHAHLLDLMYLCLLSNTYDYVRVRTYTDL